LTTALIVSGSYVVWTTQLENAYAQPDVQQKESPLTTVSADRVSVLPNGDVDFPGNMVIKNAVIKSTDSDGSQQMSLVADIATRRGDSVVAEGAVRISFEGYTLTTDRAVFDEDGTIRMDSARVSRNSQPH
jgi:lipopolysaccharide assembly outer membrane protein LptD (OstA)